MTAKSTPPDRDTLESEYSKSGSTLSSIARSYGVSHPTVRSWLKHYGISIKSHKEASAQANSRNKIAIKPSPADLKKVYAISTIDDMERAYGVGQSTIYEWLNESGIQLKTLSEAVHDGKKRAWLHNLPSRCTLDVEYNESGRNLTALAARRGVTPHIAKKMLCERGISIHTPNRSLREIEIIDYLNDMTHGWSSCDRDLIRPYELDAVHSELRLAIEYCGLYWHSEDSGGKNKEYHSRKRDMCASIGYDLITIFESDSDHFVNSLLKLKCGKAIRISARDTRVAPLSAKDCTIFEKENHAHGPRGGRVRLGLFLGDAIVMALTMGASRYDSKAEWECIRMTTKLGYVVVGGASKLFSYFVKEYSPKSMITYADLRFGNGSVYEKCGFKRIENTPPSYWYFNKHRTNISHRQAFQKHKLKSLPTFDPNLTEWQNMRLAGYDRIWDCGNAKYVWTADK